MALSSPKLGGYDYEFVEPPPDDLICLICTFVAKDPQQLTCCGKIYCQVCLEEQQKCSNRCAQCRKVGAASFEDQRSNRNIRGLKVKCSNDGCNWSGELRMLDEHESNCGYSFIVCPNRCTDSKGKITKIQQHSLSMHLKKQCKNRMVSCPYCFKSGKQADITGPHQDKCPDFLLTCPNRGCEEKVVRRGLLDHKYRCLHELVPCKFSYIGCTVRKPRNELQLHEKDSGQHLENALEAVCHLKDELIATRTMSSQSDRDNAPMFTFKMTNYQDHKTHNKEFQGPPFYTSPGGYKMNIRVNANGRGVGKDTHVSVYIHLHATKNDDSLDWPFCPAQIQIELLNQLNDRNHYKQLINYRSNKDDGDNRRVLGRLRATSGYGKPEFIAQSLLGYTPANSCHYCKDDCLYFRVTITSAPNPKPWLVCSI